MEYLIKKGNHRSGIHFAPTFFKKELEFEFALSKECCFPVNDKDDLDTNKIFGVSFGLHHHNSIRIGWVPCKEKFKVEQAGAVKEYDCYHLYIYYYNNKKRVIKKFQVTLGETFEPKFIAESTYYANFTFDTTENTCVVEISSGGLALREKFDFKFPKFKHGYYLYPYFGGNKVAPSDMKLSIIK